MVKLGLVELTRVEPVEPIYWQLLSHAQIFKMRAQECA